MWGAGKAERFPAFSDSGPLLEDLRKRERERERKKNPTYLNLTFRYSFYGWPNSFRIKALGKRMREK